MIINDRPARLGQSLVETALLLPILLLLSVVTIDLARGIYYYSVIYNAAREGTRFAIVVQQPYNTTTLDKTGIEAAARDKAIGLDQSNLTIDIRNQIISDTIKVDVIYCFNLVTPLAEKFINSNCKNGGINLKTSSTMTIER